MLLSCRNAGLAASISRAAQGHCATPVHGGRRVLHTPRGRKYDMTRWLEETAAAEAEAERFQAVEDEAEQKFHIVLAAAEQSGDKQRALESPEFQQWMNARRATDLAWSSWVLLKDAKG
jgi:hypothetical protein